MRPNRPKRVLSSVRTIAPELGQLCYWAILFSFFFCCCFSLDYILLFSLRMCEDFPCLRNQVLAPKESKTTLFSFLFSLNSLHFLVRYCSTTEACVNHKWCDGTERVALDQSQGFGIHFSAFMLSSNGDGLLNWWGLTRPKPVLSSVRTSAPELG